MFFKIENREHSCEINSDNLQYGKFILRKFYKKIDLVFLKTYLKAINILFQTCKNQWKAKYQKNSTNFEK